MRTLIDAFLRPLLLLILAAIAAGCAQVSLTPRSGIERMYVLYCGEVQVPDISPRMFGSLAFDALSTRFNSSPDGCSRIATGSGPSGPAVFSNPSSS